jgi:hypothetical protein
VGTRAGLDDVKKRKFLTSGSEVVFILNLGTGHRHTQTILFQEEDLTVPIGQEVG